MMMPLQCSGGGPYPETNGLVYRGQFSQSHPAAMACSLLTKVWLGVDVTLQSLLP